MPEKLEWVVRNTETGEVDERQTELLRQQDAEIRAEADAVIDWHVVAGPHPVAVLSGTTVPTYPTISAEQVESILHASTAATSHRPRAWRDTCDGKPDFCVELSSRINAEIRRQYDEARAAFWKDDKSLETAKARFYDAHNLVPNPENAL